MQDQIIRAITSDGGVMAAAIYSRNMVERARQIHGCTPLASAALGRSLTAASLMGNQLKGERDSLTLQIRGGGPLGNIIAVSDSQGNVRGYLQDPGLDLPLKENGKLDVGRGVGVNGSLTVIKDLGMKEPYVGSVQLISGEIAEDLAAYYVESEQIPTACALGVLVDRDRSIKTAGGYLLQLLPGADDSAVDKLEQSIAKAGAVTAMLDRGMSLQELLQAVLPDFELEFWDPQPVEYRCYCSQERVTSALISLGREELTQLADDPKGMELTCQFCDRLYHFSQEEIAQLLQEI